MEPITGARGRGYHTPHLQRLGRLADITRTMTVDSPFDGGAPHMNMASMVAPPRGHGQHGGGH